MYNIIKEIGTLKKKQQHNSNKDNQLSVIIFIKKTVFIPTDIKIFYNKSQYIFTIYLLNTHECIFLFFR